MRPSKSCVPCQSLKHVMSSISLHQANEPKASPHSPSSQPIVNLAPQTPPISPRPRALSSPLASIYWMDLLRGMALRPNQPILSYSTLPHLTRLVMFPPNEHHQYYGFKTKETSDRQSTAHRDPSSGLRPEAPATTRIRREQNGTDARTQFRSLPPTQTIRRPFLPPFHYEAYSPQSILFDQQRYLAPYRTPRTFIASLVQIADRPMMTIYYHHAYIPTRLADR